MTTRGLSAGFHLIEGFFRDDQPLCRSVLSDAEKRELDRLWDELYFVTGIWEKLLRGFVFFERSERNFLKHPDFDAFKEEDPELVKDESLARFKAVYLKRCQREGDRRRAGQAPDQRLLRRLPQRPAQACRDAQAGRADLPPATCRRSPRRPIAGR